MFLSVQNLTIRNGKKGQWLINDVSFDLHRGKMLTIFGAANSGKSLIAQALIKLLPRNLLKACTGKVLYNGLDLLTLSESQMCKIRGCKIAITFQNIITSLNIMQTLREQLSVAMEIHATSPPQENRILEVLNDLELKNEFLDVFPNSLCGEELQKAALAIAIINNPSILIIDEFDSSLGFYAKARIVLLLRKIQKKYGMSILLFTSDIKILNAAIDDVMIICKGRQIECGSGKILFNKAVHPYFQDIISDDLHCKKINSKGCFFSDTCSYSIELCGEDYPPAFNLQENGHKVCCWLFDKELGWKIDFDEYIVD